MIICEEESIRNQSDTRRILRHEQMPYTSSHDKRRIVFIGLSSFAGTSTLALAYAFYLASQAKKKKTDGIAYVDLSRHDDCVSPRSYDRIGMDKRFAGRRYQSAFQAMADGANPAAITNPDSGINWALRLPGTGEPELSDVDVLRLLNKIRGESVIVDISGSLCNEDLIKAVASDADMLVVVVDPLPSSLMSSPLRRELIYMIEARSVPCMWLVNKMNAGVDRRELKHFLGSGDYLTLPAFSSEELYAAEYSCESIYARRKLRSALVTVFDKIACF